MSAAFAPLVPSAPLAANDNDNDGNFKRVRYIADGNLIYNIYNLAGELVHVDEETANRETDYVRLGGRTVARVVDKTTPTYVHSDHLGSPVARSDTGGTVLPRERYTPFGLTLNNPTDLDDQAGFTGHIKDSASGLTYMQARYYDPIIGRFLSIDPVTFLDTGEPSQFNRYVYANNDPINMFDPFGRDSCNLNGCSDQMNIRTGEGRPTNPNSFGSKALAAVMTNLPGVGLIQAAVAGEGNIVAAAASEIPAAKALKLGKLAKTKVSTSKVGDKVATPDTHPKAFKTLRGGQGQQNKKTKEIFQKSNTNQSKDPVGEFKVGVKPGKAPTPTKKITVTRSNSCISKKDGC